MTVDDFETPNVLGGFVLDKTYEEMQYYVKHKSFPANDSKPNEPIRRGMDTEEVEEEPIESEEEETRRPTRRMGRRTPTRRKEGF